MVDDAIARRDPTLPRWASARVTRLLRELDPADRAGVVERVCARPNLPASLADDLRAAADRAGAPAPVPTAPPAAAPPSAPSQRVRRQPAPRSTSPRTRGVKTSSFKGRTLSDVPAGVSVEYQGRRAVVEPPFLVLEDGRRFQFLNPAAAYVNGGIEVNGWDAWKVDDGRSMGECYDSGSWPAPVD